MKRIISFAAVSIVSVTLGTVFAVASPRVKPVAVAADCEADRCVIQADIDAECSCADAKNHGRYTSCVARVVNKAAREGRIAKKCRNTINGCAIRSTCGKREGVVLCDQAGDGVSGRCRPLSSEAACLKRGGTVVPSCCESCSVEPSPSPTSTAPTPTQTPGGPTGTPGDATPTTGEPTATPETAEATPTATVGAPTATPETPEPTATPSVDLTATPVATATVETPVATATPITIE